ncbi:hypothetical protein [Pseudoalteromonas sp. MT33b]|uniref:hypothetical protein n=1 Tax=Pseudoalteromonas TaxID=53246 RepID=UPI0015FD0102|nr:hypothetical protein [Pseudoalteromonas sp. MT33b]QMW16730.1 hypothetical protein H3302_17240 [Pseudoalteromonas sp. MT33b]
MIKRILFSLLLSPCVSWAQTTAPSVECHAMEAERSELQSALRKTHLLDEVDDYKQRIQNLSDRIASNCLTEAQIAERKFAFYNHDIAYLENSLAKPLSEQAYISKQAAWDRFYVIPSRCLNKPLSVQYLEWCIENKQVQFQQFDMLWQQKSTQTVRSEVTSNDSFHEFKLPSKAERTKLSAEREIKRHTYKSDSFLPKNIILLCVLAVAVFFSLIFVFHWLMRPRTTLK